MPKSRLGQIKSLRQTAVPRNYEIWYVYATGYNAPLNKIINETLARNGKLSESDLEQIYETYLSHIKTSDRIDKVGARVIGEIDDVMSLITDALGMSQSYDARPERRQREAPVAKNRDQIKAVVDGAGEVHPRDAARPTRRWKTGWRCRRPRSAISSTASRRSAPRA